MSPVSPRQRPSALSLYDYKRRVCRGFLRRLLMPGNSSKKPAKHATRVTTSAPAAGTAGATDPPSGEPEVAGGNETFTTPQTQGTGRQAEVTDGKGDQSEDSKELD